MKKNGFTLIELIGTVVILAIIALIAFPATLSILNQGQDEINKSVQELVISSANKYVNENQNDYPKQLENQQTTKDNGNITVETLVNKGYLEQTIYEKYCHIQNDYIKITSNSQKYFYEYIEVEDNKEC